MDSETLPAELPIGDRPHSITPGSVPLRDPRRERYAHARVLQLKPVDAARRAGFADGTGTKTAEADATAGLRGIARKLERNRDVLARIQYLRGNDDQKLQRKHALAEEVIVRVMTASMADYTRLTEGGGIVLDTKRIAELPECEQREILAVVKAVMPSQYGTKVELLSALDAVAQYRSLNGLDAPKQVELGGIKGGAPIDVQYIQRLDRAFRSVDGG